MNDFGRQGGKSRGHLSTFQRNDDLVVPPRPQNAQHELSCVAPRKNDGPSGFPLFGGALKLREGPLPRRWQIAERDLIGQIARDFTPALVKHLSVWYRTDTVRSKCLVAS